jgi:hypothetical protein
LLLVRLGNLTYGNAKGRHKSHSRAWTTVRQGVLVRRQCVAEADGRRCDPEKRRRTLSQKEGAVCVAGGLANRGQTATRKRRRNRDSETASSLPGRDGKVAATVRGPASEKRTGRIEGRSGQPSKRLPIDGRHPGLWISCDRHGHAVFAISGSFAGSVRISEPHRGCGKATGMSEVRRTGSWKITGKKTPPTKQSRSARRSGRGVVKRRVPQVSAGNKHP